MDGRCKAVPNNTGTAQAGQREPIEWSKIRWTEIERKVEKIQRDIFQETRAGNFLNVSRAQKLLVKSLPARLLAVRRVTEQNEGRNTPGADGIIYTKDREKTKLVEELRIRDWKPDPVKIAWIPKPSGDLRKLGIPTVRDRAMQALVFLAMEPEWEARFEPNSFGFRPGRSPVDAVHYIAQALMHYNGRAMHPGWVLDADITKCFDMINHDALIAKIKGSPFQDLIRKWLKCGAISKVGFERTEKGTPQGGIISPLLANIALTGLESQFNIYSKTGRYLPPSQRSGQDKSISLFRFADDFVVIAPSREILESHVLPKIKNFLFTFQRFFRNDGTYKDFIYAPRRGRLDRFCTRLKEILKRSLHVDVPIIIDDLNRRIRGFCNYFKWGNAYKAFSYLTHRLWELLWHWCKRRHPKRGSKWLVGHYWHRVGNDRWTFTSQGKNLVHPYRLATRWWKWPKVRIHTSPYDPNEKDYWETRKKRSVI